MLTLDEIKEGNDVIASFMKFEVTLSGQHYFLDEFDSYGYANSWDWLMPVVEKIETLSFSVQIETNDCIIWYKNKEFKCFGNKKLNKLQSTYKCVTEFIKWYTTQNL